MVSEKRAKLIISMKNDGDCMYDIERPSSGATSLEYYERVIMRSLAGKSYVTINQQLIVSLPRVKTETGVVWRNTMGILKTSKLEVTKKHPVHEGRKSSLCVP